MEKSRTEIPFRRRYVRCGEGRKKGGVGSEKRGKRKRTEEDKRKADALRQQTESQKLQTSLFPVSTQFQQSS
ncbi:hypothetical protein BLNAU_23348 [Blattamonas nauphoetae]|uniref:Uncharacterized protein n=1 Tax=Blattamonas nauphoetae TaxID=2049346 RepID=A0ABQ9WTI2_9EUKA|nr:hypothetical protein BLNAU_23348 [Blattamonas nauphoetae]